MAKAKQAADTTQPIADVAEPGTTGPSDTSKSIITPRPMIKDPMVVEDAAKSEKPLEGKGKVDIKPPEGTTAEPEPEVDTPKKKSKPNPDAEKAAHEAQDAQTQKLIESKKYVLPINTVEQRKSKRFVILGIVLAVLLALAWVNIALDASLIHIDSIKPVTHFFSN